MSVKSKSTDWSKRKEFVAHTGDEPETPDERLERRKRQFKVVVNLFTNIESYVLFNWNKTRRGTPLEFVGRMCQQTGLTNLGYDIIGSLINQSDKVQIMGSPGAYELVPRAIDVVVLEREAS
jgi:hypothetical protein